MKLAVLKERRADEARVAVTPETARKLVGLGLDVVVESGAGARAAAADDAYEQAGATIARDAAAALKGAHIVFKVQRPLGPGEGEIDELALLEKATLLVCAMDPYAAGPELHLYAEAGVQAFAMEMIPRITRAQSMDILSSQASLAGYRAVLLAAEHYPRALPQMMTAAGTIQPARAFVMGAGVAGLQAIATARRLGARVSATDVRPATREQVQSLGAEFVAVEDDEFRQAEAAGGYAKQMSADYQKKQQELIAEHLKKQDIVVTTALIPGKPAPTLITEAMVKAMKPGAVIVDMAVLSGGNCPLSKPGEVVEVGGVRIVGPVNLPSTIAADASAQLARNYLNFITPLIGEGGKALAIDLEDEIVKGTLLTQGGAIIHDAFKGVARPGAPAAKPAATGAGSDKPASTRATTTKATTAKSSGTRKNSTRKTTPRKTTTSAPAKSGKAEAEAEAEAGKPAETPVEPAARTPGTDPMSEKKD